MPSSPRSLCRLTIRHGERHTCVKGVRGPMSSDDIIARYQGWIVGRARRLSRIFSCDVDDCHQMLALYLLTYESQKTAWLKAFTDLQREAGKQMLSFSDLHPDIRDALPGIAQVDCQLESMEVHELIDACLDEDQQWAVMMDQAGYTQAFIGKILNISQQRASEMLSEAYEILKEELEG